MSRSSALIATLLRTSLVLALALSLAACGVLGDVSQAAVWAGAIVVLLVLVLIAWFMQRHKS